MYMYRILFFSWAWMELIRLSVGFAVNMHVVRSGCNCDQREEDEDDYSEDESVVSSEEEDDENSFDDLFGPAESSSDDRSLPHLRGNASQTSSDTGRQVFFLKL